MVKYDKMGKENLPPKCNFQIIYANFQQPANPNFVGNNTTGYVAARNQGNGGH